MPGSGTDSLLILSNLIAKDFKVRYRNMSLGVLWSLVNPLVMMSVLTFVFTNILPTNRENFALFVLMGLLPYNFFSLAWAMGTGAIVDNNLLVKKVPFRRELLPVSVVLANALHYLIQFGLLLIAVGLILGVREAWVWLPLVVALEVVFVCGLALISSALDVYYRDTRYVVESANLVLFWLVPIFYGFDAIGNQFAWLYEMNPVAAVILIVRTVLLDGNPPNPVTLIKLACVSVVTLVAGFVVFGRSKANFSDYL